MYAVKVADADRDGKTEVYAACEDGKIYKYAWVISSWQKTEVGQGNGKMYDLAINDADNSGIDALYASCEDGHIYQFLWEDSVWKKNDLGTAGTPLLALDIGDGDNDNRYEIYAVGDNNHIYEFEASSEIPTPTPTITPTSTSTPVPGFDGRIISEKHIYAAPNPIRGHIANIVIFTNTSCEVSGKLFTTSNQEVLSFRRNYNIGKQIEHINMSNLANGVYLLLITAKNSEGVEEKVIKKIALIK
ncbi:T9SS type A sorting domain-containing protein [bacterium]|nr:T9SS type A sorting domain-containing protein [bacterium]